MCFVLQCTLKHSRAPSYVHEPSLLLSPDSIFLSLFLRPLQHINNPPMADTLNLTKDLTFSDGWPIGHGGYSDVYLGEVTRRRLSGAKKVMVKKLLPHCQKTLGLRPCSKNVFQQKVAIKAFRAFSNQQMDWERASKVARGCLPGKLTWPLILW